MPALSRSCQGGWSIQCCPCCSVTAVGCITQRGLPRVALKAQAMGQTHSVTVSESHDWARHREVKGGRQLLCHLPPATCPHRSWFGSLPHGLPGSSGQQRPQGEAWLSALLHSGTPATPVQSQVQLPASVSLAVVCRPNLRLLSHRGKGVAVAQ